MPAGRKSLREELKITRRYADLTEPAFNIIKQRLNSGYKPDVDYALDWLKGGFARLLPNITKIGGDENNTTPIPLLRVLDAQANLPQQNPPNNGVTSPADTAKVLEGKSV